MGKNRRNKMCDCGSGKKWKYCCGRDFSIKVAEGTETILEKPLSFYAKPSCKRCGGKGYVNHTLVRGENETQKVPNYCTCIREKYLSRYKKLADDKKDVEKIKKAEVADANAR